MDEVRHERVLALLLLVAAVILTFSNGFEGKFLLDDTKVIVNNPRVRHVLPQTAAEWVGPRALVDTTFAANYGTNGLNPADYHAVNLLIHALTVLLLFALTRRTLVPRTGPDARLPGATWLAATAAATWAVHPLAGSAVMYVCQRYELMAALFTVLTLYAVACASTSRRPFVWHAVAVAACLAGMASKETMIVTPLLVLVYDRTFLAGSWAEAWRKRRGLYAGLAATALYLALPRLFQSLAAGVHDYSPGRPSLCYLLLQSRVVAHYLRLIIWPHPLCLDYGWTAQPASFATPLAGAAVAVLTVAVLVLAWKRPRTGFIGVWALLLLVPTSTVFPHTDAAFEHRMYLPSASAAMAWVLALAALSRWVTRVPAARRVVFAVPAVLAIALLGLTTHLRNRDYLDAERMWLSVLDRRPDNVRAAVCLTAELSARHRDTDAVAIARQTLARAQPASGATPNPRLTVDTAQLLNNLGLALLRDGQTAEATKAFSQAVALAPGYVRAHLNYSDAAMAVGDKQTAWREAETAWRLAPHDPNALQSLADLYAVGGRPDEAAALYRQALSARPDSPPLQCRLALLLATSPDRSVRNGADALRLAQAAVAASGGQDPESAEALAAALAETGAFTNAAQTQAQVIASCGDSPTRTARLQCYRAGQPWRDARLTRSPSPANDR